MFFQIAVIVLAIVAAANAGLYHQAPVVYAHAAPIAYKTLVAPVPVIRTVAVAPVVKAVPVAPVIKTYVAPAPVIKTYAVAPVVKTVAVAPVLKAAPVSFSELLTTRLRITRIWY